MASRTASVFGRLLLLVGGFVLLVLAILYAWMPKPQADRVEPALDVVGVNTGASFSWILRTKSGAALIDVGLEPEAEAIVTELQKQGVSVDEVHTILVTHGHRDHWGGAGRFPKARIYVGEADIPLVRGERAPEATLPRLFEQMAGTPPKLGELLPLKGGETLDVDGVPIQVVHVPGHTPGSLMFLRDTLLFTGDSLFARGDDVVAPPPFVSDDVEENLRSLRALQTLPFTTIADGHTGSAADARQKLQRLLE